jgi:Ser/Thr protein kinase RdoA (MazF antagonist)
MSAALLADTAAYLHVRIDRQQNLEGSMSGSYVLPVTTADGAAAVLKVTILTPGDARDGAAREAAFYLELADRVQVRTPRLLDHRVTPELAALLLTAHRPAPPPQDWSHDRWIALATDLALLHEMDIPTDPIWRRSSWLGQTLRAPDLDVIREFWSRPGEPEILELLLADATNLESAINDLEPRFLHGDAHTGNLLTDGDCLVWTDWASAIVDSPAGDLAASISRATPSGAIPPATAMVSEYAQLRRLDPDRLLRSVIAAELIFLVLGFPLFARFNTDQGIARMHDRFQLLAREWQIG